jgi:hypothetical protein
VTGSGVVEVEVVVVGAPEVGVVGVDDVVVVVVVVAGVVVVCVVAGGGEAVLVAGVDVVPVTGTRAPFGVEDAAPQPAAASAARARRTSGGRRRNARPTALRGSNATAARSGDR